MHYLAESEAEATSGRERRSLVRAQADFLRNHLCSWWPQLEAKLKRQQPLPFYRSLAGLTSKFLDADLRYLG